jgi:hypothetical protein
MRPTGLIIWRLEFEGTGGSTLLLQYNRRPNGFFSYLVLTCQKHPSMGSRVTKFLVLLHNGQEKSSSKADDERGSEAE